MARHPYVRTFGPILVFVALLGLLAGESWGSRWDAQGSSSYRAKRPGKAGFVCSLADG